MHLLSSQAKPSHLVQDLVGGLGPLKRLALLVVRGNVREDRVSQAVTLVCDPRRNAFSVSIPKKRSTRLSQDAEVGVKCRWKRGCRSNQRCATGARCAER